jgi:hypothetical protein
MSTPRSAASKARGQARAMLAERVAARRAADKANEEDLAEFLRLQSELEAVDGRHESAIAAAKQVYVAAVARAADEHKKSIAGTKAAQAQCVRHMRDRGERVADIAVLTGLSGIEIGRLTRSSPSDAPDTEPSASDSPSPKDRSSTAD